MPLKNAFMPTQFEIMHKKIYSIFVISYNFEINNEFDNNKIIISSKIIITKLI